MIRRRILLAPLAIVAVAALLSPGWSGDAPPGVAAQSGESVTLTLLHNNDGESSLLPLTNPVEAGGATVSLQIGGIAAFKAVTERELADARGTGNSVLNVYAGDAFLASSTLVCGQDPAYPLFDAVAQRQIPYDLHVLGNHEFDYGPDFLLEFIQAFEGSQPFLSGNLDFSGEPSFAGIVDTDGLLSVPVTGGRVLGNAAVFTDAVSDEEFGVVSATTWLLPTISSPRNVALTSTDLASTAALLQTQIDQLTAQGVNRIILVSHLQNIDNDRALVRLLRDVDIAVAGGGDELLENPTIPAATEFLPGETTTPYGTYPLEETDAAGDTVYIVTTSGNYKYVGRIDAEFDAAGSITSIVAEKSYPRRVVPTGAVATQLGVTDAVTPDAGLISTIVGPLNDCIAELATTTVATTEVLLDVSRSGARSRESNAGNLVADAFVASYDRYHTDLGLPARSAGNPVIGVQNGGGIRQNAGDVLPRSGTVPGALTRLDTLDVLPFANFVSVVSNVTPSDLKTIFEHSGDLLPGEGGQFLQVSGITVVFDVSQPAGSRVRSLTLTDGTAIVANGQVVAGAPSVRVVTNHFTADGGDDYPTFANNPSTLQLPSSYELSLREYLEELGTISASDPRYAPGGEGRITILTAAPTPTPTVPAPTATPTTAPATATATVAPPTATAPAPTATPTKAAPQPPQTGTGSTATGGGASAAVLWIALTLLAVGGGAALVARRR